MMRSMFSGVSGLRSHQTMMDVVGNNVANVNTPGYKASQATFQETLTQTVRGAAPGSGVIGGTNPIQIGLGTQVATVDGIFTQGAAQPTGRTTDLMIQGDGYFVLGRGAERFYSRAGSFGFDNEGFLVNGNGLMIMGWNAVGGVVDTSTAIQAIQIPAAQVIAPQATGNVALGGNLSADAADGTTVRSSITVHDSLGTAHELVLTFTKTGGDWQVSGDLAGVGPVTIDTGGGSDILQFTNGELPAGTTMSIAAAVPGADPLNITVDLTSGNSPLVQFGGTSNVEVVTADGHAMGILQDVSIGVDGTITAQFSNGMTDTIAVIATATFVNPGGLNRVGESTFAASANSGPAVIGQPGSGDRGSLIPGALEMSNVDLAREFTNLIIAQRGFQANSRVITASDELLADLVNIRR